MISPLEIRTTLKSKEKKLSATVALSFTKDTAEKTGKSERAIQMLTQINGARR